MNECVRVFHKVWIGSNALQNSALAAGQDGTGQDRLQGDCMATGRRSGKAALWLVRGEACENLAKPRARSNGLARERRPRGADNLDQATITLICDMDICIKYLLLKYTPLKLAPLIII